MQNLFWQFPQVLQEQGPATLLCYHTSMQQLYRSICSQEANLLSLGSRCEISCTPLARKMLFLHLRMSKLKKKKARAPSPLKNPRAFGWLPRGASVAKVDLSVRSFSGGGCRRRLRLCGSDFGAP